MTLGWLFTGVAPFVGLGTREVLVAWTLLMFFPVTFTLEEYRKGESNRLFNLWALAVALLMVENFISPLRFQAFSFFPAWFILGAAGFYYTSRKLPPPSKATYLRAAYLNVAATPIYLLNIYMTPFIAAAVQGGPMLYDWLQVHSSLPDPILYLKKKT